MDSEFKVILQFHMLGVAKLHMGSCLPDDNIHIDANEIKKQLDELDSMKLPSRLLS